MYEVTSHSYWMAAQFPGSVDNDSPPWEPVVVGRHASLEEARAQVTRISQANGGQLPTNREISIREVKS